jgi:iron complex transport system substrate-binding protein
MNQHPSLRIVSLLSSATETVCALGLGECLVGISHECDGPPEILDRPRLSSTKIDPKKRSAEIDADVRTLVREALSIYEVDERRLAELKPDLILTQDHCAVCAVTLDDVEAACRRLTGTEAKVVSTRPETLDAIRADFRRIAAAAGVAERGEDLVRRFDARLEAVATRARGLAPVRVALVEWIDPPMIAGGWMPELAALAGADPILLKEAGHFLTVDWSQIAAEDPDVVLVMPCGFDQERTLDELDACQGRRVLESLRATRAGRTFAADGNAFFNRPGPGIAESAEILAAACHPERFVARGRLRRWPARSPLP